MNIKTSPALLRFPLAVSLFSLGLLALHATEDGSTATAKLSAPNKPATLRVDLPWADIHITGVDGDTVTVSSTLKQQGADEEREDGLRRLDDESNFALNEKDNVVTLTLVGDNPMFGGNEADFRISLPRTMALDIRTDLGGDLRVNGVAGDIDINNTNGEVHLENIAGSAVVNTMNGEVHASYAQAPQKLISITSMNGEIDLQLPVETKANVQLRTQNGSIFTDFDKARLKTKSGGKNASDVARSKAMADEIRAGQAQMQASIQAAADAAAAAALSGTPRPPRAPRPPLPPVMGGKLISGTLNGGGVDINISTMNGKVMLRQNGKAAPASSIDSETKDNVTVTFQDPDKFTDAGDDRSILTSTNVLNDLRDYVQQTAAPLLAAGSKLTVTFLDIDLAGMIRPDKNNIRFMTSASIPRVHLSFQLLGTDGQVVKEGERKLSDMNYQQTIGTLNRNDSLYYDKQLLKEWIGKEFKAGS